MDLFLKSIIHIKRRIEFICNTQNLVNTNYFKNVLYQNYRHTHTHTHTTFYYDKLDVHGSVHHNINRIEITNQMQPCSRIYYSNVS
jgi:hypothetical protein